MKNSIKYSSVLILAFVSFGFACPKNKLKKAIVGSWSNSGYVENSIVADKSDSLAKDSPGIQFNKDGTLIKRQNAGWCGTPPITYSNQEGNWTVLNDSTIRISYSYWRGPVEEDLWIQSVNDTKLQYQIIASRNIEETKD
jgi:hypothetical protein